MAGTQAKDEAAARDQTTHHDTRQLLDELDALMDQMLALPIDDRDDVAAPQPVLAAAPPTISATLTLVEPAAAPVVAEAPSEAAATLRPTRFDVATSTDQSPTTPLESGRPSSTQEEQLSAPILTDVAAPALVQLLSPPQRIPTARWRPDHLSYRFLLWVNQRFDHATTKVGVVGQVLRSRAAKLLLGFAGLGLLFVALAWLGKDWLLGWNW